MKFLWKDPLEWLFPDTLCSLKRGMGNVCIDVPRGGCASVAAVILDVPAGEKITLSCDDEQCRIFEMLDVCVNRNTAEVSFAAREGNPKSRSVVRDAPFREFDVLKNCSGSAAASGNGNAFYIMRHAGYDEVPGEKNITLTVCAGKKVVKKNFSVNVSRVKLPEVGVNSAVMTNWFNIEHFGFPRRLKLWSHEFWQALGDNARLMYHMRQNTMFVPLEHFFQYDKESGRYTLESRLLKQYIDAFTSCGMYWIESGHLGKRDGSWFTTEFKVLLSDNPVRSRAGAADIAQMAGLLRNFIEENNLKERWIQHVADEPIACNADCYRIFCGIVRKYLPGITIMDALSDLDIAGAVDIWCPQAQVYQREQKAFEATRQQGDKVWIYTCCHPGGPWLNRLSDGELLRPLLLGWGCGINGIDGFLHWGWNQFRHYTRGDLPEIQDPFEDLAPLQHDTAINFLPPGDTHIVYPSEDGKVWSSLRLEAQREGMEDWELIRMLKAKSPEKCAEITGKVFKTFKNFAKTPGKVRAARRELLKALE